MEILELIELVALVLAFGTLIFVAHQTRLLRKQIFGEVYSKPVIRGPEFYLPEKRKHIVKYFSERQKDDEEIPLGSKIEIPKKKEVELHVRFWLDAPQRLRIISFGFLNRLKGHPVVIKNIRAFVRKEYGTIPRCETKDWHDHYTIEYVNPRRMPKGECVVCSFSVKGYKEGRFPLAFNICTEEAREEFREKLWVIVR